MEHIKLINRSAWGGILLSIIGDITGQDIIKTIVLGVIGTVVSFAMSALLNKLFGNRK